MIRVSTLATVSLAAMATAAFTTVAFAGPQLERIRGTVESATDTAITVKTADGATKVVTVAPGTKYVYVVKSSLDEVKDGKFIGTATKGENPPVALEVVVFPASMNGTAEGHYGWDAISDTTEGGAHMAKSSMMAKDSMMAKSAMTNGTVKSTGAPLTKSAMTNGTIKSGTTMGGDKMIDVTYDNGQSLKIKVPASAPIVAFDPADKSIVKSGTTLFAVAVVDGDKLDGKLVAIGKDGVKPPM